MVAQGSQTYKIHFNDSIECLYLKMWNIISCFFVSGLWSEIIPEMEISLNAHTSTSLSLSIPAAPSTYNKQCAWGEPLSWIQLWWHDQLPFLMDSQQYIYSLKKCLTWNQNIWAHVSGLDCKYKILFFKVIFKTSSLINFFPIWMPTACIILASGNQQLIVSKTMLEHQ